MRERKKQPARNVSARKGDQRIATVKLSQFEDALVIHFATEGRRINAYTFASTLVALADAAKAANASINPGYEVEVVVEAIGPGSFRALIRTLYNKSRNLLGNQVVLAIVVGIITNYIYERTFAMDNAVKVEIKTDEVIIKRGNDRIIVPRNIYDSTRIAEKNPNFSKAVTRAFDAIGRDTDIEGIGFVPAIDCPPPGVLIKRDEVQAAALLPIETPTDRIVPEQVDLQIIKAILQRSKRKWEFMWRGVKISAPVVDDKFYVDFFAHDITIAPGDILHVTLHVYQSKDLDTGIYRNVKYEVVQVLRHTPRVKQLHFPDVGTNG
jgi:hypothetical protein